MSHVQSSWRAPFGRGPRVRGALVAVLALSACGSNDAKSQADMNGHGGGSSSAAGAAGMGGSEGMVPNVDCEPVFARGEEASIDDFETPGQTLNEVEGRNGVWFATQSDVQFEEREPGDPPESGRALQVTVGQENATIRRSLAAWFHTEEGVACPYDASVFLGVGFWVKGEGTFRIELAVPGTTRREDGGRCSGDGCENFHGLGIEASKGWKYHEVPFESMAQQPGWGQPASFDPAELMGLRFAFGSGQVADVWLDQVAFYPEGGKLRDAGSDAGGEVDADAPSSEAGSPPGADASDGVDLLSDAAVPDSGISDASASGDDAGPDAAIDGG